MSETLKRELDKLRVDIRESDCDQAVKEELLRLHEERERKTRARLARITKGVDNHIARIRKVLAQKAPGRWGGHKKKVPPYKAPRPEGSGSRGPVPKRLLCEPQTST